MRDGIKHFNKYRAKQDLINSRDAIKELICRRMLLKKNLKTITVNLIKADIETL